MKFNAPSLKTPYGMSVTINTHVFSTSDRTSDLMNIGIFNSFIDQYTVFALGDGGDLTLELFFQDNGGGAFASDALPLIPPGLGSFGLLDFHLHQIFETGEVQVDGQITSLTLLEPGDGGGAVPEPSTVALGCGGLVLLLVLRRFKEKRS